MRACPSRIWPFSLIYAKKNHRCQNYGKISHKSLTNHALQRIGTHTYTPIFFQWFSVIRRCYKRETWVICLLIVSWKSSMNAIAATFHKPSLIFHACFAHYPRKNYANYAKKLRKTAQYCVNSYAKPSSGLGVTKAPFVNFSVSKIFNLAEVPVRLFVSHSYLTGVTAAELRQHLSNMNMIFNR